MRFALLKARTRPAEYDHIPDIVNDPISIIVSIVVGVALQAASALLRDDPTPVQQENEETRVGQERLSNQIGPSRFNQTSSFDGFASLVEYGKAVPIPFGKMGEGADGKRTGGLVLAGSLVWSRAYSEGTYQRIKLLYTLGQWTPAAPKKRGVWLGTTSLSALGSSDFALYWKSQEGENRIKAANWIQDAGSRGTPDAGDPETQDETFIAPVDGTVEGPGFSQVYNPNSASRFGQFNPIRNGTSHRLNWEVISILQNILRKEDKDFLDQDEYEDDEQEAVRRARAKRVKNGGEFSSVVGFQANSDVAGQPGVGRAYSSQTGLVAYAKPGGDWIGVEDKIPFLDVDVDWHVRFRIHNNDFTELDDTGYMFQNLLKGKPEDYGLDHEDVRASADSRRSRADDLMVLGSKWMIGQTIWVVTERSNYAWDPLGDPVIVTLKCKGAVGPSRIGIAGQRAVKEPLAGYEGPWIERFAGPKPDFVSDNGFNTKKHCGAAFWNICRYEVASVRMIRAADTIEFGIKSTVWNKANSLCNFNAILRPKVQADRDMDNINVTTPFMNRYFKRTSCFSIWVRPVAQFQDNEDDESQPWVRINQVLCVTGDSPRAMYNYIRLRPRTPGRYEFRFIPRTGSDIATNSNEGAIFFQLSTNGEAIAQDFSTAYGVFRLTANGNKVTREQVLLCSEMVTKPKQAVVLPPVDTKTPTSITNYLWSNNAGSDQFPKNAWLHEFLGSAFNKPVGFVGRSTVVHLKRRGSGTQDDGYIKVQIQATVNTQAGPKHLQNYGTYNNWAGNGSQIVFTVLADDPETRGQWEINDVFTITANISSSNPYRRWGYSQVNAAFRVTNVRTNTPSGGGIQDPTNGERFFELATQVSDCSHYDEIEKSCDSGPEHEISYVVEAVSESTDDGDDGIPQYEDLAMLGLSIKSGPQVTSIEQPRVWINGGVLVERLTTNGVKGVSNLFSDLVYYLLTNQSQGVGEVVPSELVDRDSFAKTGQFLLQNKIHSNGVVESIGNIRDFVTSHAGKHLCIFTIKNGIFGMQPALPIDSGNGISTGPVPIDQIFTKGNILEGSYSMSYKNAEERREIAYAVRYRTMRSYELPEETTAVVRFAGTEPKVIEDLDLTQFCDNEAQALMVARYALAAQRFVDHSIEFQTTPEVVGVEPGGYIRVMTEEIEFDASLSLVVNNDLSFKSARQIPDGKHSAFVYKSGEPDAVEREIEIKNQRVTDPSLAGAIVSVFSASLSDSIYQVQEITIDENAIVSITAIVVPTEGDNSSTVAKHTVTPSLFEVVK